MNVAGIAVAMLFGFAAPALAGVSFVVEVDNSRGLKPGDAVVSGTETIGEVESVGFGDRDTVDVAIEVDDAHRAAVRESSAFVIEEPVAGETRPRVGHYVLDPGSPVATDGHRFRGSQSIAEVWLRRGQISADELARAMNQGVDTLRRNLEHLQQSPHWAKFKEQIARLSAEITVTGAELARLLEQQLPRLQQELDSLYEDYRREVEKQRTPTP
jgi:ABC-type transporter Mla subunit MlaD